jgi:tRNA dimethylallyltransferase
MNKLVVILGPTASGKTELSIKLAKKYNGEVVSADSRQIYKGLDVGSGKVTKKEMQGIPHHLLSIANPKRKFSVAQYQKLALKAIRNIQKKGKLPILVGGTGFYIQSVADGVLIPEVKPNWELREKLEKLTTAQMSEKLEKLDAERAKNIDKNNPRRLVRALEIVLSTGKPVQKLQNNNSQFSVIKIGIKKSKKNLEQLINKRLIKRLAKNAIIDEVKNLRKTLSWKRLEEFGLEYKFVAQYLQNKITRQEMIDKIQKESEHYAKRQMTWFSAHGGSASGGKKDQRIRWIINHKEAFTLIDKFIKKC